MARLWTNGFELNSIAMDTNVAATGSPTVSTTTGKAAAMTTNPCYTNFLTTQLQTSAAAAAGDTATVTCTLQYNEN